MRGPLPRPAPQRSGGPTVTGWSSPNVVRLLCVLTVLCSGIAVPTLNSDSALAAPLERDEFQMSSSGSVPLPPESLDITPQQYYLLWARASSDGSTNIPPPSEVAEILRSDSPEKEIPTNETTLVAAAADTGPVTYRNSRQLDSAWNGQNWGGFKKTSEDVSHRPQSVSVKDGAWVKDAYIDLVSIDSSITVHEEGGSSRKYIRPAGTVRGLFDYRLSIPDIDGLNFSEGDTTIERTRVTNKTVHGPFLHVKYNSNEKQFKAGAPPDLKARFSEIPPGTVATLSLEADIIVETRKTKDVFECKKVNESTSEPTCDQWVYQDTITQNTTETLTLRDSEQVTVTDPSLSRRILYNLNTREAYMQVSVPPYITHVSVGDQVVLGTYAHYTKRDVSYQEFVATNSTDTWSYRSPITPVQTYAIPVRERPRPVSRSRFDGVKTVETTTTPISGAQSAGGVALSPPNTSYAPQQLTIYYPDITKGSSASSLLQTTAGTLFSTDNHAPTTQLKEFTAANLTTNFTLEDGTYELTIQLTTEESGQPIATTNHPDLHLTVARSGSDVQTVQTDPNGRVTLSYDQGEVGAFSMFKIRFVDEQRFDGPAYTVDPARTSPPPANYGQALLGATLGFLGHPATVTVISIVVLFGLFDWMTPGQWLNLTPGNLFKR